MDGFAGAVLTGGASRRMGRDKALAPFRGRPLAAVATGALRAAGAIDVVMVGGDLTALADHGLNGIADDYPGEGPLGGLLTALSWSPLEVIVVLSCDMAAVTAAEVGALVEGLHNDRFASVAAALVEGRPQYLTAAYRRSALGALQNCFDGGERAVRRAVAKAGLKVKPIYGLDPRHLADVDTPEALMLADQSVCHHPSER